MSYVRKTRSGPELGVGGFSTSESMMSGGKRRKKRATKKRKTKRSGMGIKAKPAGIMTDKKHSWGKGHKF